MTLDDAGVQVVHHFVGGLYAKETHIPAGIKLTQHKHTYAHLSALLHGSVVLNVEGVRTVHHAPAMLTIAAGLVHEVQAVTDVVWVCLHATAETDHEKVDAGLIA